MIYLTFQQKLTDFALKLLELNLNKLNQKQINLIKVELTDLIIEAKELEKFFVSTEENDFLPFSGVILPNGTIEKIIGRKLTWDDEPVKINFNNK